jgi:hypothetical protein
LARSRSDNAKRNVERSVDNYGSNARSSTPYRVGGGPFMAGNGGYLGKESGEYSSGRG